MPRRFATAVWVSPAAMRQCRTFFANCDTPLLLLVLEVWRSFSAISHSAYPTSWTVAMTTGALFASSNSLSIDMYWRNRCRVDQLSDLAPDGRKQPFVGDRSTRVVEETGQQC